MSPRRRTISLILILIAVVLGIALIKRGLQPKFHAATPVVRNPVSLPQANTEEDLRSQLDVAQRELETLREQFQQTTDPESHIQDTNAKIAAVQSQLAKLDGEKNEIDFNSQSYQRQLDIQQYDTQVDLEQQITDLDASIANLSEQHADEAQIANLRATREQLINRMENVVASMSYGRMVSRQEAMEGSSQVTAERGELESQLAQLHKELDYWNQTGQHAEPSTAREDDRAGLQKKIADQETVVRQLETELRTRYTR